MSAAFFATLLKPLIALAVLVPVAYAAHGIERRMKPGKLKKILFRRIS